MPDSSGKRLALFRESLGFSQQQLATALGTSRGRVGMIETDKAPPSRAFLEKLSNRYSVSSEWLLFGEGEMIRARGVSFLGRSAEVEPPDYARPAHGDVRLDGEDFALIRRFRINVSAGPGIVPDDEAEDGTLAFSTRWLTKNGVNADLAGLVRVSGDSMTPTIPDGSLVLVHLPEMQVDTAAIYAFSRSGEAFVKRITPIGAEPGQRPTALAIESDAPGWPTEYVSGDDLNELRIIGRVRCVMTTL
jgi:phage repressor protein C with HTH and peptisase S24 domain